MLPCCCPLACHLHPLSVLWRGRGGTRRRRRAHAFLVVFASAQLWNLSRGLQQDFQQTLSGVGFTLIRLFFLSKPGAPSAMMLSAPHLAVGRSASPWIGAVKARLQRHLGRTKGKSERAYDRGWDQGGPTRFPLRNSFVKRRHRAVERNLGWCSCCRCSDSTLGGYRSVRIYGALSQALYQSRPSPAERRCSSNSSYHFPRSGSDARGTAAVLNSTTVGSSGSPALDVCSSTGVPSVLELGEQTTVRQACYCHS